MIKYLNEIAKREGFALLELSLALVIIGILLGLSLNLMLHISKTNREKVDIDKIKKIREVIEGYLLKNNRLPYADVNNDGLEDVGKYTGSIPYKTLKISRNEASDVYGEVMKYDVAGTAMGEPSMTDTTSNTICLQMGAYIDGIASSPVMLTEDKGVNWTELPFIVLSPGVNKVYEPENNDADRHYYINYGISSRQIDDVATWDNFFELYDKLHCGKEYFDLLVSSGSIWVSGGKYVGCTEVTHGDYAFITKDVHGAGSKLQCESCAISSCPISFHNCETADFGLSGNRNGKVKWNGSAIVDDD